MDFTLSLDHRTIDLINQTLAEKLPKVKAMIARDFPGHSDSTNDLALPRDPALIDYINDALARELPKIQTIIDRQQSCRCGSPRTWDHTDKAWACEANCSL